MEKWVLLIRVTSCLRRHWCRSSIRPTNKRRICRRPMAFLISAKTRGNLMKVRRIRNRHCCRTSTGSCRCSPSCRRGSLLRSRNCCNGSHPRSTGPASLRCCSCCCSRTSWSICDLYKKKLYIVKMTDDYIWSN
jgi:hypothetical protein